MSNTDVVKSMGWVLVFLGCLFSLLIFPIFIAILGLMIVGTAPKPKRVICQNCRYTEIL